MSARSLPADDADHGQALLGLLDEAGVAVDAALWLWSADEARWEFTVAGSGVPEPIPSAAAALAASLGRAEGDLLVDPGRLVIRPVDDALLVALGRRVQVGGSSRVRLGDNTVDGIAVPPTLVYRLQLGGDGARGRSRVRAADPDHRLRAEHRARRRADANRRRLERRLARRRRP
ncbi:MAG: hypothetical protein AAGE88_05910 [Actinomycetota bacterium]